MHINTRLFSLLIGINEYKRNGRALKFAWFLYPSVYFIHAYTHMVYGLGRYFYMRHRTSNKFFIAFLRALNRDRFDWLLFSLCLFFLLIFFFGLLVISLCFSSFSAVRTPCVHNFITWNHCHCVRAIMELLFSLYYYYYCYERIINAKIENFCIKKKNYLREKCMVDVSGYNNKCRKHNGHNDVV